ncbi:hypothetical protein F5144DRAFT_570458 [Chaetomium tenue]|uniref:Uncharacterized protein n=1 Tax=Chaetomium tenue TaxID=1854479 RepID=A0ACB7P8S6_9PEZI|nr:hypothetical protein F5144DRAFT_570458 [Chaetomium globosum]
MPHLTSSFASAAAGQNRDSRGSGRSDSSRGAGSGEWPRSNGTRTFRRPSTTPFNQPSSTDSADVSQHTANDPANMSSHTPPTALDSQSPRQYNKDKMLEVYNSYDPSQFDTAAIMPNWNPEQLNGGHARPWGKSSDSPHVPQDPSVCWDSSGTQQPISFEDMSAEEREMFATDVNSTLKPPQQNKEGAHPGPGGLNGRKASISVGNQTHHPNSSPSTASRPGTRRRETADTNPFPGQSTASPTANRYGREEPWLPRRSTELKETVSDEPEEETSARDAAPGRPQQPFGLPRSNTTGTSGFGGQSSLWGPAPAPAPTSTGIGAFGNFALTAPGTGDKRFGAAGGSRLAHLIPKDSVDGAGPKPSDAPSWRPRQRTDTDPFAADDGSSGGAMLGGGHDNSPPATVGHHRGGLFDTPVKGNAGDFGMAGLNLGNHGDGAGPASPSETNPFRSPMADRSGDGHIDSDVDRLVHPGPGSDHQSNFGTFPRSFSTAAFDGSDRSQTSSVGAKGFANVMPLSGWPAGPSAGTPDRERAPFQHPFPGGFLNSFNDLPSPGLSGLSGVFGPPSASRLGRGKLESLFPPAMQAQMHNHDQDSLSDSMPDLRQANPLGAIGRSTIGLQRDTDSPARSGRGGFEDLIPASDSARSPFSTVEHGPSGLTSTAQAQSFPTTAGGASFPTSQSADPAAARTMVMPDRMRWVYLDPQGTVQGPFSGLEMHDWYKGHFFTPDLRVKRLEDNDFEPLGQLIRRIGNSREPFLVPQMGIPHGPPPSGGPFGGPTTEAVPPLPNAFPSFGRTLTAQQQNDLERRKQEEQMHQARQREMHHHTGFGRLPPIQPGGLHHHSSAHSLQSQPSFGSMTSPIGVTPQHSLGPIAPAGGFFDSALNMAPGPAQAPMGPASGHYQELNFNERQMLANMPSTGDLSGAFSGAQAPGGPVGEGSGLRSQLPSVDQLQRDSEGFSERLEEFHELRAQFDAEQADAAAASESRDNGAEQGEKASVEATVESTQEAGAAGSGSAEASMTRTQAELTLTEKVRKTQADNARSEPAPASDLPMPFPPPAQATPLPAPTAQRLASNLPARYGDRSGSGSPDTTSDGAALAPPPTAPWAPQPGAEAQKGPSLREIQEAEAKKAAKKEEAAAAARRAALEQEVALQREREKAAAAAASSGLPAASTWGTGSPVGAPSGSPWKQPATLKTAVVAAASGSTASKKTLADIQREEELRKQKSAKEAAAAAAATQANTTPAPSIGKRYADLASKGSGSPGPMASAVAAQPVQSGGWATVGAGGKVKAPTGPAVQSRSPSVGNAKGTSSPILAKPAARPGQTTARDAKDWAMEEFKKWLHRELGRGLIGVTDIEQFAVALLEMPLDPAILSEAVYGNSKTMDGRHFAEEFVRRKKLADRGVVEKEPASATTEGKNSGWNEVAKKGGSSGGSGGASLSAGGSSATAPKDDIPGFRVVASKKNKGKK